MSKPLWVDWWFGDLNPVLARGEWEASTKTLIGGKLTLLFLCQGHFVDKRSSFLSTLILPRDFALKKGCAWKKQGPHTPGRGSFSGQFLLHPGERCWR